ncbi:MAG: sigma-70 family RNA polymerase sigma factor [Thermodesulfobacteria bacterium]|nr:sigma-70 family RNA polymerase sigma factor [Thermodesulfobacteriota bacterium]
MSLQSKKNFCLFDEEELLLEEMESDGWMGEEEPEPEEEEQCSRKLEDPIKLYFKEVFSHSLLTREDEVRIGRTIEENERKILKEVFKYYASCAKFYHLLVQSKRKGRLMLLFKDIDELEKEGRLEEWFEDIKCMTERLLDNFYRESAQTLIDQIIEKIYEVRPTKPLLEELGCEFLEAYERKNSLNRLKQRIKNRYKLEDGVINAIFSVDGNFGKLDTLLQELCVAKSDIEKLKRELRLYKKFLKQVDEFFGEDPEKVYKSGEVICKAFQEIKKCKEEMVKSNLRLIIALARKYSPKGMFLADLIQEGNIGLLKAIEKFDYRKGFKFSTYATWWIRQSITRYLAENTRTIRIPLHIIETIYKISKIISTKFYQEYGRDPTLDELAKETGLSIEKLNYVFKVMKQPISLESTIGDEEDSILRDFIEDQNAVKPDEVTFNTALAEKIRDLLKTLSPREEKIIRMRFGIGEKESYTLEEVGNKFGVTKERIRQIENIALRKLKHPNRIKLLKNFLIYGA